MMDASYNIAPIVSTVSLRSKETIGKLKQTKGVLFMDLLSHQPPWDRLSCETTHITQGKVT